MKQAYKVADALEVQRQIADVRTEIEKLEAGYWLAMSSAEPSDGNRRASYNPLQSPTNKKVKMPRSCLILINLFMLLALTACSRSDQNSPGESAAKPAAATQTAQVTSQSVVKVTAQPVEVPVGGTAEAIVRISIQPGYHINANPPTYAFLKATELEIPASEGVSVGFIKYPNPISMKFSFAEKPLEVYEGETELRVLFKAAESSNKSNRAVNGKLRIQACDNQVCYPPGSLEVVIPVTIT